METMLDFLIPRMNYLAYVLLMISGFWGIALKKNYMKKIIGLNILQTAIILFFISAGSKQGATLPILGHGHDIQAAAYINPLPHVLMLTAIVVAVATLGVALALAIRIYGFYGTLDEAQVLAAAQSGTKAFRSEKRAEKGGRHG